MQERCASGTCFHQVEDRGNDARENKGSGREAKAQAAQHKRAGYEGEYEEEGSRAEGDGSSYRQPSRQQAKQYGTCKPMQLNELSTLIY